jgi:hypothetical protein
MAFLDFVKDSLADVAPYTPGLVRALVVALVEELYKDVLKAPLSVKLFRHYTAGSGEPYHLGEIPAEWQSWILREVARRRLKTGGPHEMKAYDGSAPFDLRHVLGTFTLTVLEPPRKAGQLPSARRQYLLHDRYKFGYNCKQRDPTASRHGFLLPKSTTKEQKDRLRGVLPTQTYQHPCGFTERFAVEERREGAYLMLPQIWLAEVGREFDVDGSFVR